MKKFEMPEMKVMTVSAKERIAASGTPVPNLSINGVNGTFYADDDGNLTGTYIRPDLIANTNKGQFKKHYEDTLRASGCYVG